MHTMHGGDVLSGFFFLPFSMPWLITRGDPWRSVTLGRAVTSDLSPPVIGLVNIVHLARTPGGQKLGDLLTKGEKLGVPG